MNCFPCFSSRKNKKSNGRSLHVVAHASCDPDEVSQLPVFVKQKQSPEAENRKDAARTVNTGNIAAQTFTFRELAAATKNFRKECLLGEGGFGKVFKGTLNDNGQVVAVKQLDRNGTQENKEFLVEVLMLSLLHHPNLVSLVGYCADGEQRLLVYEYMPLGSLEDKLFETSQQEPLNWLTRMKIALGAAQGLQYLHHKANPPVIYRDLKPSNILLDEYFNPKLSDFGLAKLGQTGNKMHTSPRVIGSYGYSAPEYEGTGELTSKSDVYSFGVVLLELITGRRAIDTTRRLDEQNLVSWAQPIFKDPRRFPEMADPLLKLDFPVRSLNQAVGVAAMCLQEEPSVRPLISDVVAALNILTQLQDEPNLSSLPVSKQPEVNISNDEYSSEDHQYGDYSDQEDESRALYPKDESISSNGYVDSSDYNGEPKKPVKKSIRWSSDIMRKHKDSPSGSFNSNSRHIDNNGSPDVSVHQNTKLNSNMETQDASSRSISRQNSKMASQDSVDSNPRHKSEVRTLGLNSRNVHNLRSKSTMEPRNRSVGPNLRCNSVMISRGGSDGLNRSCNNDGL